MHTKNVYYYKRALKFNLAEKKKQDELHKADEVQLDQKKEAR